MKTTYAKKRKQLKAISNHGFKTILTNFERNQINARWFLFSFYFYKIIYFLINFNILDF